MNAKQNKTIGSAHQYSETSGGTDIIQQSTSNDGNMRQSAKNSGGNIVQERGDINFDGGYLLLPWNWSVFKVVPA